MRVLESLNGSASEVGWLLNAAKFNSGLERASHND